MSHRHRRRRCVTGKRRYDTQEDCERFIESVNRGPALFLLGYKLERAYQCKKCGGWHATKETMEEYEESRRKGEEGTQTSWRSLATTYEDHPC